MILTKYDIKGETYVKLDELNDLLKQERKLLAQTMKERHKDGKDNTCYAVAHSQMTVFARKVNMTEGGDKYVIFARDEHGEWEYLVDLVRWDELREHMPKAAQKTKNEWAIITTREIDKAAWYDSHEEAKAKLERLAEKTLADGWHMTKKWMFDTKENRESLLAVFYDGGEEPEKKPEKRTPHIPPRYTVWYRDDGETTQHCMGFVRYEKGIPVYTNRPCKASWFTYKEAAEKVAADCGEGFEVVDMWDTMTKEERLLRAIFLDEHNPNDEPCEWHGDGTKAEDEDWDGDD